MYPSSQYYYLKVSLTNRQCVYSTLYTLVVLQILQTHCWCCRVLAELDVDRRLFPQDSHLLIARLGSHSVTGGAFSWDANKVIKCSCFQSVPLTSFNPFHCWKQSFHMCTGCWKYSKSSQETTFPLCVVKLVETVHSDSTSDCLESVAQSAVVVALILVTGTGGISSRLKLSFCWPSITFAFYFGGITLASYAAVQCSESTWRQT